ncbi:RelA/SpoT domain-containing protein [Curtobacterium sp. MCBA15_004]|uniref:RelA/SpoT domain-containing protein n=1 Tax=Curtobacterium sp. MCBA15_004 TaxID=1898733 RepID=UPI0008DDFEAD|nr:RelA/SpoT domain-containing protein [Curtobacterium sp. MCBA15_004]WIA97609.1 RelA/SpoT domain-containing protein [Curtobacterium sp. MCBA15_004]
MAHDVPSTSQVKKAGSRIRKFLRGDDPDPGHFYDAVETMERWRAAHYTPLVSANNGLRSRARTIGVEAEVSQRLKRRQTILDKLGREPNLDLSRMQDIGGCRAVVPTIDDLRRLEDRIRNGRLPVIRYSDYVQSPRESGYRGVHVVVSYEERAVEVQLRTKVMHNWALATEYYSAFVGENLKQDGDHPVQLFLRTASDIMAMQEYGEPVPDDMVQLHSERRLEASKHLRESNR